MTKRIFSVMIALVMVVALAVPAFAATPETSSPVDEPIVERYVPMPCCGAPEGWETVRRDVDKLECWKNNLLPLWLLELCWGLSGS